MLWGKIFSSSHVLWARDKMLCCSNITGAKDKSISCSNIPGARCKMIYCSNVSGTRGKIISWCTFEPEIILPLAPDTCEEEIILPHSLTYSWTRYYLTSSLVHICACEYEISYSQIFKNDCLFIGSNCILYNFVIENECREKDDCSHLHCSFHLKPHCVSCTFQQEIILPLAPDTFEQEIILSIDLIHVKKR
jgi:hypothetical protein